MSRLDWSSLPEDRATTMLKLYELAGWPPGLLMVQRHLLVRTWRRMRRNLSQWWQWSGRKPEAGKADVGSRPAPAPAPLIRQHAECQT